MQLFVRAQEAHLVEFGEAATVADVKAYVAQAEGIAAGEQVICYAGVPLEDDVTVSSFQALAALDVTARLVGGTYIRFLFLCVSLSLHVSCVRVRSVLSLVRVRCVLFFINCEVILVGR